MNPFPVNFIALFPINELSTGVNVGLVDHYFLKTLFIGDDTV
jgi:hypothetical protein